MSQYRVRSAAIAVIALAVAVVASQPAAHASAHKKKLKATPTPTVSGTAQVGRALTARPGTWKPAGVKLTYRWYVGKTAVKGATHQHFTVPAADAGKKLSVTVTGSKRGYTSVTKRSKPTKAVRAGSLTATPTPTITGTAAVGSTLTARPGTWKPAGVRLAYRWASGGTTIAGATTPTYQPVPTDAGKPVTVTVTGSKAGYTTVSRTSAATAAVTIDAVTMQPALQNCFDDQLDEPDGTPVSTDQLATITSLQCGGYGITDISPLAGATDLVILELNGNDLASIAAIGSMSSLTQLTLRSANVSDLTPLASLPQLEGLDLGNNFPADDTDHPFPNQIADLSPLSGLTHLTYLDVTNNRITDLSPIAAVISTDPLDFLQLSGQSKTLGTATIGTPFTLPAVTSPSGDTEPLAVGSDSSAQGSVAGDSSSVTWTDAGSGTGELVWSDASIAFGSGEHAVFAGTLTQPVVGGCRATRSVGAAC